MPVTAYHVQKATVDGVEFKRVSQVDGVGQDKVAPTVAPGKAGTLNTRTDANTGIVGMVTGHGLSTSQIADAFWSGGSRYGMTLTVSGDNVTIDGGTGDDLPVTTTAMRIKVPESVPFTLDGDTLTSLVASIASEVAVDGYVHFFDDSVTPARILAYQVGKDFATIWTGEGASPLAGELTTLAKFSHGYSADRVMTLIAITGTDS